MWPPPERLATWWQKWHVLVTCMRAVLATKSVRGQYMYKSWQFVPLQQWILTMLSVTMCTLPSLVVARDKTDIVVCACGQQLTGVADLQQARKTSPFVHMCIVGLSNQFCLSVCLSACLSVNQSSKCPHGRDWETFNFVHFQQFLGSLDCPQMVKSLSG